MKQRLVKERKPVKEFKECLRRVQESIKGVVGRFQVKQHLANLGVIQFIRRRHAA